MLGHAEGLGQVGVEAGSMRLTLGEGQPMSVRKPDQGVVFGVVPTVLSSADGVAEAHLVQVPQGSSL